jgi:hypothetical protein
MVVQKFALFRCGHASEHAFDGEQTTEFGICRTVAAARNDCAKLNAHADSFRKSYFAVGLYDHGVKCEDVP